MHDELLPSEARADCKPEDPVLSVVQVGKSGNTPVFRCPYHAWTYDLSGALVSYPPGMPRDFDPAQHGLHPAHVRTVEGFIYVSFAQDEPPEFDPFVAHVARRDRPAVWDGAIEGGGAPVAADEGELEAGAGELPGVLSLFTVA